MGRKDVVNGPDKCLITRALFTMELFAGGWNLKGLSPEINAILHGLPIRYCMSWMGTFYIFVPS
jgi:hypothetical protein